jgi:hypothetical protein
VYPFQISLEWVFTHTKLTYFSENWYIVNVRPERKTMKEAKKTYNFTIIQDFEYLRYDVNIQADNLDEAWVLAKKPENRPDWVKEAITKASELGIEANHRCEIWEHCELVPEE